MPVLEELRLRRLRSGLTVHYSTFSPRVLCWTNSEVVMSDLAIKSRVGKAIDYFIWHDDFGWLKVDEATHKEYCDYYAQKALEEEKKC
jgi:hypothetical protein